MQPVTQGTIVTASAGTAATPGTVTGTGIDWSPTYQPDLKMFASCGAVSSGGTVIAYAQGSNTDSGYTSLGSAVFTADDDDTVKEVDLDPRTAVYRYYRSLTTVAAGTAVGGISTGFIGRPRTT